MSNVLVTGSNGFTGKTLVRMLEQNSFKVFNLDCDITKKKELNEFIKDLNPTFVFHLAAISSLEFSNHEMINEVNVDGTKNLLTTLNNMVKLPKLVVIPSSAYVYGDPESDYLSEQSRIAPRSIYAKSKLEVEKLCKNFTSFPILITRPFNYTGVDQQSSFLVPKIINHFKLRKKEIELGNINVKREFNDVRDVCEIYIKFLKNINFSTTVNICSGNTYSIKDIINICTKLTGHSINIKVNPKFKRKKEISNIIGNPQKMRSLVGNHLFRNLEDTIEFMLHN